MALKFTGWIHEKLHPGEGSQDSNQCKLGSNESNAYSQLTKEWGERSLNRQRCHQNRKCGSCQIKILTF